MKREGMKVRAFKGRYIVCVFTERLVLKALGFLLLYNTIYAQSPSKEDFRKSHEEVLSRMKTNIESHTVSPTHFSSTPFQIYRVNQYPDLSPQNEPSVRINPNNLDNIVVAYRDFHLGWEPAIRNVSIAATTDGGLTWTEQLANYLDHNRYTDPAVGVDLNGNFFIATLDWYEHNFLMESTMVSVRKSSDGGMTWLPAIPAGPFGTNYDKNMIWVDDGLLSPYLNNIYVAWSGMIGFSRSTDQGMSFSLPADSPQVGHPSIATGPHGEVYIVGFGTFGKKSTDGGVHFSGYFHAEDTIRPASYGVDVSPGLWSLSEPVVGVDRSESSVRTGTVYVVYPSLALGDADLFCVRSIDSGTTWSPAVRVNNDTVANGRDQFHFWLTVDDSGFVDVVFLDRRNDPNNILCDAYFAQSRDGGRSFKNFKITPQNFDPRITPNNNVRLGEYIGIDARQNRIVPVWVDTHLGNQDIYIATIDQDETGTISGNVTWGDSLAAMNVAVLIFHDNGIDSAFSDSVGNYSFDGLFPGTYSVRLQNGYIGTPDTFSVDITSGETIAGKDFRIITTGIKGEENRLPQVYSLFQNYPNPFNPTTTISFSLPSRSFVSLKIFDLLGKEIESLVSEELSAGNYTKAWNPGNSASGVYFYRIVAGSFSETKKLLLLR